MLRYEAREGPLARPTDPSPGGSQTHERPRAKRAHRLSDLLGEDHDLAVLREHTAQADVAFGQEATRTALLSVIDRRRASLQREAFKLGVRVYGRRPKSFARSVERGWGSRANGGG